MPIDSTKFFDSIRVKPKLSAKQEKRAREEVVTCEWHDCKEKGSNGSRGKGKGASAADIDGASDPFSMFSELNGRGRWRPGPGAEAKTETRKVFNAERKALQVMGLGPEATLQDVKVKYKALVKQHHPDANGGDRSTEGGLFGIIKAYNYLKTVVRESWVIPSGPRCCGDKTKACICAGLDGGKWFRPEIERTRADQ